MVSPSVHFPPERASLTQTPCQVRVAFQCLVQLVYSSGDSGFVLALPVSLSQTGERFTPHSHVGYRTVCSYARERLPGDQEPPTFTVMCQRGRSPFTHRTPLWPQTHRRRSTNMGSRAEKSVHQKGASEEETVWHRSQVSVTCSTSHRRKWREPGFRGFLSSHFASVSSSATAC